MIVRPLSTVSIDTLLDVFLKAFKNYFVPMPTEKAYYTQRWAATGVDYEQSYGMFDGDQLVGFVLHALDTESGTLTAYNAGTGVLPEYRGQKIVASIYKVALQAFVEMGVAEVVLEVITENKSAIRSYERIGFEIATTYRCYHGTPHTLLDNDIITKKVEWDALEGMFSSNQKQYAWDHQLARLRRGNYQGYQVFRKEEPEAYFILNPETGHLAQFDGLTPKNDAKSWERLFTAIGQVVPSIKANNVDARQTNKIDYLERSGLENVIDQYGMRLTIS